MLGHGEGEAELGGRPAEGWTRGLDRRVSGFTDPSRAWRTPACFSLCGHWRAVEPRLQKAGCARRRAPVCAIRFHSCSEG